MPNRTPDSSWTEADWKREYKNYGPPKDPTTRAGRVAKARADRRGAIIRHSDPRPRISTLEKRARQKSFETKSKLPKVN
jgi:hypothetical protein